jgi:H+/Cl- antiporter ClcA
MSTPPPRNPIKLLRIATALVVLFALGLTAWLVGAAVLNPDVKAKRPSWVETGAWDVSFWLPLIATVVGGAACVAYVYVKAARRLREGEDLFGNSYRERAKRGAPEGEQL